MEKLMDEGLAGKQAVRKREKMACETAWITGVCMLCAGGIFAWLWQQGFSFPDCLILEWTGYYCPACGGSRAFMSLLEGRVFRSLWYHPAVLYGITAYVLYTFSITWNYFWGEKKRLPVLYHKRVLYVGAGLFILNFYLKLWLS